MATNNVIMSRKVAREIIDLLFTVEGDSDEVARVLDVLTTALDDAQGDADEEEQEFTITVLPGAI